MTERDLIIPVHTEPVEAQIAQLRRWIEGYVDNDGTRRPGLIELVGELYDELKTRRERREAVGRVLATGSVITLFGFFLNWMKDHWK